MPGTVDRECLNDPAISSPLRHHVLRCVEGPGGGAGSLIERALVDDQPISEPLVGVVIGDKPHGGSKRPFGVVSAAQGETSSLELKSRALFGFDHAAGVGAAHRTPLIGS